MESPERGQARLSVQGVWMRPMNMTVASLRAGMSTVTSPGLIVAIRDAWQHVGAWALLKSSTLYTSCEPCLLCSFVITQIGVRRVVFAARGTDVPGYKPLLGADLAKAAAWVNAQPDWPRIEVVGDFMRDQARDVIAAFPWSQAQSRDGLEPPG